MSNPVSPSPIFATIAHLRSLSQVNIQSSWHYCDRDLPIDTVCQTATLQPWAIGELNSKQHIAWAKGRQVRWLVQQITVPQDLQGFPLQGLCLRLALTWWAELAQLFVNGQLVQEGDLFDCSTRLLLSPNVAPGDRFTIALRLVSPGHDDGALVKSLCLYETASPDELPEPGFIADELEVLHLYLSTFAPEKVEILAQAIASLPLCPSPLSLAHLRQSLLPLSSLLKQRHIHLLGHAHLDMAWLWTVAETWRAAERTFESVLNLQKDFPELVFCHSTPALYAWMEQHRPELFSQIQQQVESGRWEPVGGIWVEPELNLISGESIVRQILYGQRYFQEKFGHISPIAWLPDTFGFNWQLPQFLRQGGIDYFVTQKLRWNDTTQFPYELFQWQAPDGTQMLSLMSAPIGEGIDPVKMATYACDWETKTGIAAALWLPGVGDHGGGPSRDMLELARRWQRSPFFPQLEFTTSLDYLKQLSAISGQNPESRIQNSEFRIQNPEFRIQNPESSPTLLPTWNSDLYLEFHRGCYTTHADQKWWNRQCETWLYLAELYAAVATLTAHTPYPKMAIETAWKHMLFNQFHDILPGSAIREVYEDADQSWQEAAQASNIIDTALTTIAGQIRLPPPPDPNAMAVVVFNPCSWERSAIAHATINQALINQALIDGEALTEAALTETTWQVWDLDGREVEVPGCSWMKRPDGSGWELSFLAERVPALGYRCFWIHPHAPAKQSTQANRQAPKDMTGDRHVLENEFLRVVVDPATGDLARVFDKVNQREVLSGAGNQLQAFRDRGQYWDAWNIDPNYQQQALPAPELLSLKGISAGFNSALISRIQVDRRIGQSVFTQTYILECGSPLLKIETSVDWQERHVLVKAAFPLNLEADCATYEIPCGAIQRTTKPESDREKAQWEVPAMRWADLSDSSDGVSLLNDCKYGYDCQPNQIRLTLLRGSEWPNPKADRGHHRFTYALYPHAGSWQVAQTVRHGYELNMPFQVVLLPAGQATEGTLPPAGQFLNLGAENLVLMAFKQAEGSLDEWVLRCYECHGEVADLNLQSDLSLHLGQPVDLLERSLGSISTSEQVTRISPWKIASFKLKTSL